RSSDLGRRFESCKVHIILEEYPSPAEGIGLENRQGLNGPRGFESLFLRHFYNNLIRLIYAYFWRNTHVRLKGSFLKTDRSLTARGGATPCSSAIDINTAGGRRLA